MLDTATVSMAYTETDYFNRENMMPFIRYYERMSSKVRNTTNASESIADDTSLKYIKNRSERMFGEIDEKYKAF